MPLPPIEREADRRGVGGRCRNRRGLLGDLMGLEDGADALDQGRCLAHDHGAGANLPGADRELLVPPDEAKAVLWRDRPDIPRDLILVRPIGGEFGDGLPRLLGERSVVLATDLDADLMTVDRVDAVLGNECLAVPVGGADGTGRPSRLTTKWIIPAQDQAVVLSAVRCLNTDTVVGQRIHVGTAEPGVSSPQRSVDAMPDTPFDLSLSEVVLTRALR